MSGKDNRFESQKILEETLKNDNLLLEYFNTYLCLPTFPKRLLLKNEVFEEAVCKSVVVENNETNNCIKYSIKFLEKEHGFKWIMAHRLALFLQSTLFAEYKLAILLFSQQKTVMKIIEKDFYSKSNEWQTYINKILSDQPIVDDNQVRNGILNLKNDDDSKKLLESSKKQFMDSFKVFLCETAGENLVLLWIDIEVLKQLPCLQRERCLRSIKECFFSSGSPFKIPYETLKSWKVESPLSYENLILIQDMILNPILTYWLPRFMFHYLLGKSSNYRTECSNIQSIHCFQNGFKHDEFFYYHNVEDISCRQFHLFSPNVLNQSMLKSAWFKNNFFLDEKQQRSDLNFLIEVLQCEKRTGYYFSNYLEKVKNSYWQNCYLFWMSVQQYHKLFFSSSFSPDTVKKKVNYIYSMFICPMSRHDLKLPEEINRIIYDELDPPYEDLFDNVEQETLLVLLTPFLQLVENENCDYETLVIHERYDYIQDGSTSDMNGKDQSIINKECFKSLLEIDHYRMDQHKQKNTDFMKLLENEDSRKSFQTFLESNHKIGLMDLMAYIDMQDYMNASDLSYKDSQAVYISQTWFNKNYFLGFNSPAPLEIVTNLLFTAKNVSGSIYQVPDEIAITELQKYVFKRLERFYLNMNSKKNLQHEKDEIPKKPTVLKKPNPNRYRSQQSDIRFNENSCEVKAFRNALNEPNMCASFKKFIGIYCSELEKNLDFWSEVQKYKYLCHRHVDDHIIENKFRAIVDVFIHSSVPPTLQIDITEEMANELLARRRIKNPQPYVFREAQAEVFRILFSAWADFDLHRTSNNLSLETGEERKLLSQHSRNNENKQIERKISNYKNEMKLKQCEYLSRETNESPTATFIYSKHMTEQRLSENSTFKGNSLEALTSKINKVSKIKDITNLTNYSSKVSNNKGTSRVSSYKDNLRENNETIKLPLIQKLRTTNLSIRTKDYEIVKRLPKQLLPEVIVS